MIETATSVVIQTATKEKRTYETRSKVGRALQPQYPCDEGLPVPYFFLSFINVFNSLS